MNPSIGSRERRQNRVTPKTSYLRLPFAAPPGPVVSDSPQRQPPRPCRDTWTRISTVIRSEAEEVSFLYLYAHGQARFWRPRLFQT